MEEENNELSTIRVRKATIKKLEELKLVDTESLESVILRIIKYAPTVKIVIEPNTFNSTGDSKPVTVDGQQDKN